MTPSQLSDLSAKGVCQHCIEILSHLPSTWTPRHSIPLKQHNAFGLCCQCDNPVEHSTQYCAFHLARRNAQKRAAYKGKPWRKGGPGRPPKSSKPADALAAFVA
jgi:hypothetical protein